MADLDLTNFQGFLDYPGLDYYDEKNKEWTEDKITIETERATNVENTLQAQINTKAPLESPALIGTPTAPTASSGDNTEQIATTAFVQNAIANFIEMTDSEVESLWNEIFQ